MIPERVIDKARSAAGDALVVYEDAPVSFKLAMKSVAEVGADAAMRVLLVELLHEAEFRVAETGMNATERLNAFWSDFNALLQELGVDDRCCA